RAFKKLPSLRYETVGAFADALGAAHGLEGGHHVWAELPERVLAESLAKRPPSEAPATPQPRDVADSFFGEDDSLGEAAFLGVRPGPRLPAIPVASGQDSAGPDAHAAELAKPPAPHEPVRDDEGPLLIPGLGDPAGPRWLWWGVALVAALVLGAFIWVL
ncbi:MAG TPA: hypothetical protein VLC09_18540, partial [Polyangiaceae bacterium]|nr:hypothetical protein [Polyangiaceae bacterium]